jgi:hypothetical protein
MPGTVEQTFDDITTHAMENTHFGWDPIRDTVLCGDKPAELAESNRKSRTLFTDFWFASSDCPTGNVSHRLPAIQRQQYQELDHNPAWNCPPLLFVALHGLFGYAQYLRKLDLRTVQDGTDLSDCRRKGHARACQPVTLSPFRQLLLVAVTHGLVCFLLFCNVHIPDLPTGEGTASGETLITLFPSYIGYHSVAYL